MAPLDHYPIRTGCREGYSKLAGKDHTSMFPLYAMIVIALFVFVVAIVGANRAGSK
jgi:hypothetical protein